MTRPLPPKLAPLRGEWDRKNLLGDSSAILSYFNTDENHFLIVWVLPSQPAEYHYYYTRVCVWTLSTHQESEHEKLFCPEKFKYVPWLSGNSLPADVLWGSFVTHSFLPHEPQRTSTGRLVWKAIFKIPDKTTFCINDCVKLVFRSNSTCRTDNLQVI